MSSRNIFLCSLTWWRLVSTLSAREWDELRSDSDRRMRTGEGRCRGVRRGEGEEEEMVLVAMLTPLVVWGDDSLPSSLAPSAVPPFSSSSGSFAALTSMARRLLLPLPRRRARSHSRTVVCGVWEAGCRGFKRCLWFGMWVRSGVRGGLKNKAQWECDRSGPGSLALHTKERGAAHGGEERALHFYELNVEARLAKGLEFEAVSQYNAAKPIDRFDSIDASIDRRQCCPECLCVRPSIEVRPIASMQSRLTCLAPP